MDAHGYSRNDRGVSTFAGAARHTHCGIGIIHSRVWSRGAANRPGRYAIAILAQRHGKPHRHPRAASRGGGLHGGLSHT